MEDNYLILDCFVDEPACFGVPPFISPYPRYIYGALIDAGININNINYYTIDTIRSSDYKIPDQYKMIFLIGGAIVPGKYLGYEIGSYTEISKIIKLNNKQEFAIGGLISYKLKNENFQNITLIKNDIEQFAYTYAKNTPEDKLRNYQSLNRWANLGAQVVTLHPDYPNLIAEIETYRGCLRDRHCSFCSEAIFKHTPCRDQIDIIKEIDSLINKNIKRFRIGRQADILAYKSRCDQYKNGFPLPNPSEVKLLFDQLKKRVTAGEIITLNVDNANPGTIANYPEESKEILESIVDAITPGDTLPLGVESFDQSLLEKNNLKVNKDDLIAAVSLINKIGHKRVGNIPKLLPGINIIQGLIGETKNTFKLNYLALKEIKDKNLLIKRINIRKLSPFPGTIISEQKKNSSKILINRYEFYKDKIRKEIDHHMLKQIYPVSTILKDVRIEDTRFDFSYGRQLISYAIIIKIPMLLEKKSILSVIVINQRERSLIGLPYPIKINEISQKALELIPGVSKKISSELVLKRPFTNVDNIIKIAPSISDNILNALEF